MLAAHLRRLERPVRYAALDPAHQRAIENYLRINTRAHGIPQLHQQGQPHLQSLYQDHPEIVPHVQGILQGDHAALMQYLDLLNEHANLNHQTAPVGHPLHLLLDYLGGMNSFIGEGRDWGHGSGGNIHTMYSQAALEHPSTRDVVRQSGRSIQQRIVGLLDDVLHPAHSAFQHPAEQVRQAANRVYTSMGSPAYLPQLHDALEKLHPMMGVSGSEARRTTNEVAGQMRNQLIPHLAENFG